MLPSAYRIIYIEPFQNKIPINQEVSERLGFQTSLPRLEGDVTRGVYDQFLFDGNLRVTTKPAEADLKISGNILDFSRQALRQAPNQTVEEYRLNLVASVSLRNREGALVWEEPNVIGDTTYFVTGPSAKDESVAVKELITDFSRRVVERVVENW